ncbi:MAG: hypothetical protein KAU21_13100, partial [Gammaproteobacteria bacterium]|nr:hypothetical protein [Gammaproteobacteria bacterium]
SVRSIVCIISGELVNFSYLDIPAKNKQRALQAIPFALEEQLAEDIELIHFATSKAENNIYPVAAIKHDLIQSILNSLKENGIQPDYLYPDILCLPEVEDSWSFFNYQNDVGINLKRDTIIHSDLDMLPIILQTILQQTDESVLPETFEFWSNNEDELAELSIPENITLNRHQYNSSPVSLFAANINHSKLVNLLQNSYQVNKQSSQWWKPWQAAAALIITVIVLELFSASLTLNRLETENNNLSREITKIYKKSFPASKRIVNARVQMENKLKQLRKSNGKETLSFTDILANAAPVLQQANTIVINDINYHNNKLEIQFTIDNLSSVETLKERLNKLQNIKAELLSASSESKQVNARIKLEAI